MEFSSEFGTQHANCNTPLVPTANLCCICALLHAVELQEVIHEWLDCVYEITHFYFVMTQPGSF